MNIKLKLIKGSQTNIGFKTIEVVAIQLARTRLVKSNSHPDIYGEADEITHYDYEYVCICDNKHLMEFSGDDLYQDLLCNYEVVKS